MKLKSIIISGLCLLGLGFTSCDDQDDASYSPELDKYTPEFYFDSMEDTSFDFGETDTQFEIPLYRASKEGAATAQVECTITGEGGTVDPATLFTVPTSVTFQDGEDKANIVVTFDPAQCEGAIPYVFTFKVGDGENTPYCNQTFTYTATYFPWEDVVGPNGETTGVYVDVILMDAGYLKNSVPMEVAIQSSPAIKGLYRVVDPYKYLADVNGLPYTPGHYLYFNAANPKKVFLCNAQGNPLDGDEPAMFYTGISIQYGEIMISGMYNYGVALGKASAAASYLGTLEKGIVKFPLKGLIFAEPEYEDGAFYNGNQTGEFRIILPGYEEEPEVPEWESIGNCAYTDPFIYPMYGFDTPQTYDVAVEKSTKTAGLFRLVNPYKEGVMPDGTAYEGDKYIQFSVEDPEFVTVPYQNTGFQDENDGDTYIVNAGYFYTQMLTNSVADVTAAGLNDTYDATTFTVKIPSAHTKCAWPSTADADGNVNFYTPEIEIEGSIVMNDKAAAQAKAHVMANTNYSGSFVKILRKNGIKCSPVKFSNNNHKLTRKYVKKVVKFHK